MARGEICDPDRVETFALEDTMPRRMPCVIVLFFVSFLASAQTTLNGAGSTFVYPIMSKWAAEYHKQHQETLVSYLPLGSGVGIAQTMAGMLDFGGTDAPVSDAELAKAKVSVIHVPVVLGADVPAYNLPEVRTQLRFTGQVLADIFLGTIKNWNDPAIASANQGVALPNQEITVVHRLDGSGTTYIWADYLSKVSDAWKNKVGKGTSVKWPVGLGANGNEGVSERIREVKGAIGYVELSYAQNKRIPFGSVRNPSGLFIAASVGAIKEAAASAVDTQSDLRVSISNALGPNAYPVASFSWILVPVRARSPESKKALKEFLGWILTDGQKYAADLYYSPLPPEVVAKAQKVLEEYR
jgi:phosphate transport system substrate-binding protein